MTHHLVTFPTRLVILLRAHLAPLAIVVAAVALYVVRQVVEQGTSGTSVPFDFSTPGALLAFVVPLVFAGVCRDVAGETSFLWLQKPVDPVRFSLARLAEAATLGVGLPILLFGAVLMGLMPVAGWDMALSDTATMIPRVVLTALTLVCIGFGASAWLPRVGRLATLVFVLFSIAVDIQAILGGGAAGLPPPGPFRRLLFPTFALSDLEAFLDGTATSLLKPLAWVLGYAAVWIAVGILGVRTRRPIVRA